MKALIKQLPKSRYDEEMPSPVSKSTVNITKRICSTDSLSPLLKGGLSAKSNIQVMKENYGALKTPTLNTIRASPSLIPSIGTGDSKLSRMTPHRARA